MPLKADISHMVKLKFAIEALLGTSAWYALKETTSLPEWRRHLIKVLDAVGVAFSESVKICDDRLRAQVRENLESRVQALKESRDFDTLISSFAATLMQQTFIHLGMLPRRGTGSRVTLDKRFWQLDSFRSVQYVSSSKQLASQFWFDQQSALGVNKQMDLHFEYRHSKSAKSYESWCTDRGA